MDPLQSEIRKEFQLERIVYFSDAVFAIAITLLTLEIKIPEIRQNISDHALGMALLDLLPKFAGFIFSYLMIGLYWSVHHFIFGYVIHTSPKLLRLNLFFLFFIVLMPFSTGFYGDYMGGELVSAQLKIPMTFYALNLTFVGISNYFLWNYISNPKNKLIEKPIDNYTLHMSKARSLIVPGVTLCMLPVAYFGNTFFAAFVPSLIPLAMKIAHRQISKKYPHLKSK
jgi:uncharacterized membrane protein